MRPARIHRKNHAKNRFFLKTALLPAFWHHAGRDLDRFWAHFGCPLGAPFLHLFVFFRRLFAGAFSKAFLGRPGGEKGIIWDPRGGQKSCSRLGAVRYFRKATFSAQNAPGSSAEPFFGSPLGPLLGHFRKFSRHRFSTHFWAPRGDRQNNFFGPPGSHLTGIGAKRRMGPKLEFWRPFGHKCRYLRRKTGVFEKG